MILTDPLLAPLASPLLITSLLTLLLAPLLSDLRVIDVVYAKPTDLPTKMIVKFAPPDFSARLLTDLFDLSRAEINFYQKMQSDLSIVDTPRCFFTDFDPLSNRYVLIIEHLTHTRRASFRDFLKPNCVSIEEAKMCMAQLARLHAKFWGKGGTEKAPWLNRADNKLVEDLIPMQEKIMWGKFSTKTQGGTTPKDWSYEIPKELVEYWPKVRKNTFLYMSRLESHPFRTCIHGDTRLDNWFFYDDAKGEAQAGLIDWQLISVGVSVQDLSWFFLGSVDEEFCQKHEEDLLDTYLKELNSNLEENIDSEAFYEEYALSYFHAVVKSMMACNKVSKGDERDIRICDKMMVGALNGMKRRNTWEGEISRGAKDWRRPSS